MVYDTETVMKNYIESTVARLLIKVIAVFLVALITTHAAPTLSAPSIAACNAYKSPSLSLSEAMMLVTWNNEAYWQIKGLADRAKSTVESTLAESLDAKTAVEAQRCYVASLTASGNLDKSIELANSIVAENPGTISAAWAQYYFAEALSAAGEASSAAAELRKVISMLPDRKDLRPLAAADLLLGGLIADQLAEHADLLKAGSSLGFSLADPKSRLDLCGALAIYKGRKGRIDDALPLLKLIEQEYPQETDKIQWYKARVAISYLKATGCSGTFAATAVKWLNELPRKADDDLAAEACLWCARYYARNTSMSDCLATIERGVERFSGTARGSQLLYAWGSCLDRQGKHSEALGKMSELAGPKSPDPSYRLLARFFVDQHKSLGNIGNVVDAIDRCEAEFDTRWRHLAYCPVDPILDRPWMSAAQSVALIKEGFNEQALNVITDLGNRQRFSQADLLNARGEVLLSSMRLAPDLGHLLRAQPEIVLPLLDTVKNPRNDETEAALLKLGDRVLLNIECSDSDHISPKDRAEWFVRVAESYAQSGHINTAVRIYKKAVLVPNLPRESQASVAFRRGMFLYSKAQRVDAACAVMRQLARYYAETTWGQSAANLLLQWDNDRRDNSSIGRMTTVK